MSSDPRTVSSAEWEAAQTLPPDHVPNVFKVDDYTVAKTGLMEDQAKCEVAAMELARERTSIPVPKIINCYLVEETQTWCILMEFVKGETLDTVWHRISEDAKSNVIDQLKGYLNELRDVKGVSIGTVNGQACRDQFFEDQDEAYGPYTTEADFHAGLIKAMRATKSNAWVDMVAGFVQSLPEHDIVFTHSDLAPRNIIIRDERVIAILDWELAGYYPAYWEYVKAYYLPSWDSTWITDRIPDQILQPYPIEHAVLAHANRIVLS